MLRSRKIFRARLVSKDQNIWQNTLCSDESTMTEALSSDEATRRWKFLVGIENLKATNEVKPRTRKRSLSTFLSPSSSKNITRSSVLDQVDDPFDCRELAVLPTHDLVEKTVRHYMEQWKKLEERKIIQKPRRVQDELTRQESISGAEKSGKRKRRSTNYGGGWRAVEDRLFLPDGFDFNQKSSDEQLVQYETPVPESYKGDVVVSLTNPSQKLSYHGQLSKLFHSIPSCEELEKEAQRGHRVENTLKVYQETFDTTKPLDSYTVARMRLPDRHGLPESLPSSLQSNERRLLDSTIVLEFWRQYPKGCMTLGYHRMIAEFQADQTLLEVHVLLSNMAEDQLWVRAHGRQTFEGDGNSSNENPSMVEQARGEENDEELDDRKDGQENTSGCFFIENKFYETGSVDYVKPIIEWIDGGKASDPKSIRRAFLGIDSSNLTKSSKAMKNTKLSQLSFRPNVRYYHACHGDVETTVMLIDRRMICRKGDGKPISYPLLHDVWMAPRAPAVPFCNACRINQAVFKTSTNCKITDGGPRSLCQECCQDLGLLKNERESVKLYREWSDQAFLSNRIGRDDSETL